MPLLVIAGLAATPALQMGCGPSGGAHPEAIERAQMADSSQCTIDGSSYDAGAQNPTNPCQVCTPSSSTAQWSSYSAEWVTEPGVVTPVPLPSIPSPLPSDWTQVPDASGVAATDTDNINSAISNLPDGGTVYIADGTYHVLADPLGMDCGNPSNFGSGGIQLKSNMTLRLSSSAVLEAYQPQTGCYTVVSAAGVSNVYIEGGNVVGDFGSHDGGTNTQQGMGVAVVGSSNVYVVGVSVTDTWGDGVYLSHDAGGGVTNGAWVCGVTVDHARRNGISLSGASNATITDCVFQNAGQSVNGQAGVGPSAGGDIEPEVPSQGVTVQGCAFMLSVGPGLAMSGLTSYIDGGVQVTGNYFHSNSYGMVMANVSNATVSGNEFVSQANEGILMGDWTPVDGGMEYFPVTACTFADNLFLDNLVAMYVTNESNENSFLGNTCETSSLDLWIAEQDNSTNNTFDAGPNGSGCVVVTGQ